MTSPYDSFAWFYDLYWVTPHEEWQKPALEQLLYPGLPAGAHVLDLCCGTGQLSRTLVDRGFRVTGVDGSSEMLRYAAQKAPDATFVHADAADFAIAEPADAVVCAFDSLNHILQTDRLRLAFENVHRCLKPGGHFVFDINTPAAYGPRWDGSATEIAPDHAFFLRGGFDRQLRIGTTKITMFRLTEGWQRWDVEVQQRPLEEAAIQQMLCDAGFVDIRTYRPAEDLGMSGHYGEGRIYFAAWR